MHKKNTKYWIMGSIAVIIAIGLTFPFIIAKSHLNSLITELRNEGLPVTPRKFADKYYKPIPENENAAKTFDEAYALYKEEKDYKRLIIVGTAQAPRYDQKIAPALLSPAQEFIKANSDLLNKMGEIQKYDRFHFDYEWGKGFEIPLPRLIKIRNTAKIYSVKAELIINKNDPKKASELLKEMFHLCKLASQSPFMISQLVFYACDTMALSRLERCMNTLTFSPEQLKEFEKLCNEHEQYVIKRWPYMWKAELTLTLAFAKLNIVKESRFFSPYKSYPYIKDIPNKYRIAFYYYSGGFINDMFFQIKSYKAMMNVPVDIYVKRKLELEKIRDNNKVSKNSWLFSRRNINLYLKTLKKIARLRCAKTACAVEHFHLKYKKFPKDLKQLVPGFLVKVPVDPFDGKDLRYFRGSFDMQYEVPIAPKKEKKEEKKEEKEDSMFGPEIPNSDITYKPVTARKKGFYIYSIGADLMDDKGLALWERVRKDILFIVIDKK